MPENNGKANTVLSFSFVFLGVLKGYSAIGHIFWVGKLPTFISKRTRETEMKSLSKEVTTILWELFMFVNLSVIHPRANLRDLLYRQL